MTPGSQANQLLQAVEGMLPAIREAAAEVDAQRTLPEWLVQRLADAGVFRMLLGGGTRWVGIGPGHHG